MSRQTALWAHIRQPVECTVPGAGRLAAPIASTPTNHDHPAVATRSHLDHLPPYSRTSRPSAAQFAATAPLSTESMAAGFLLLIIPDISGSSIASVLQSLQEELERRSPTSRSRRLRRGHHALPPWRHLAETLRHTGDGRCFINDGDRTCCGIRLPHHPSPTRRSSRHPRRPRRTEAARHAFSCQASSGRLFRRPGKFLRRM